MEHCVTIMEDFPGEAGDCGMHGNMQDGIQKRSKHNVEKNGTTLHDHRTPAEMDAAQRLLEDRQSLVLWKRPFSTLHYFFLELNELFIDFLQRLWKNKIVVFLVLLLLGILYTMAHTAGPHAQYIKYFQSQSSWCLYWVGLGVLSSIGFGTGLHTFLLYLGPHIASVTMAAYTCQSLDFPSPPYPNEIICPDDKTPKMVITIWAIMSKVRLEAFMWGAGTALGELPPYFMAKAARLSGMDPEDENFEELQRIRNDPSRQTIFNRVQFLIEDIVKRVGFFGILACASIPNPLFDLAGIICGQCLVSFWTFFGATLIGKAIIKMHIQKMFVIIAFNETLVEKTVEMLKYIPIFGKLLQAPFREFLDKQKAKLKAKPGSQVEKGPSWLAWLFEKLIIAMIVFFVISIVNSMAQSYHKHIHRKRAQEALDTGATSSAAKIAVD